MITQKDLVERLHYDSGSGIFTWKKGAFRGVSEGKAAGHIRKDGRLQIEIDSKPYLCHRLAWLYVYGEWPRHHIDHINGNCADNRISNLRDVDRTTNLQNQSRAHKNSISGLLGAHRNNKNTWKACIKVGGNRIYLGTFKTPEEANAAYLEAKRTLHKGCAI